MINLVGCSPSSGSTFLADLLDSSDQSACGEELNCFAVRALYDFDKIKKGRAIRSLSSIYLYREAVNADVLHHYGLNTSDFMKIVQKSADINEFSKNFAGYYLALRGKNKEGVVYEKTPQNILCIAEFLENCPDSYFIFLVRNPLYVYDSMRRRGFTPYIAIATWFLECAKFFAYRDHPRVLLIRYEDLVKEPYACTSVIFQKTAGFRVLPDKIEQHYKDNIFRQLFSVRLKTWQTQKIGAVVDCNQHKISAVILKEFSSFYSLSVNSDFGRKFQISGVPPLELLDLFGYRESVDHLTAPYFSQLDKPSKTYKDQVRLFLRWMMAVHLKEAKIGDLSCFLNPILFH